MPEAGRRDDTGMSTPIPTCEPTQIRAGDALQFARSFSDYPPSDWTLKYYLRGYGLDKIDITGSTSGSEFLVSVAAATTSTWRAGVYDIVGVVVSATERNQIYAGRVEVLPDFAQAENNFDTRSQARRTLDNINAVLESRASSTILNSTIEGTIFERLNHEQLLTLKDRYEVIVANEERAAGIRRSKTVFAQFTTPR